MSARVPRCHPTLTHILSAFLPFSSPLPLSPASFTLLCSPPHPRLRASLTPVGWYAGVNITSLDVSCSGGDSLSVYGGPTTSDPLLWAGCRSAMVPFVVGLEVPTSVASKTLLVTFLSGSGPASGIGTGWQVGGTAFRCLAFALLRRLIVV